MHKYYKHLKLIIIIVTVILIKPVLNAQTGVFYYEITNNQFTNTRLTNIVEQNKSIFLFSRCSDTKYKHHEILLQNITLTGLLKSSVVAQVPNLSQIIKVNALTDTTFVLFGNSMLNKMSEPFTATISSLGNVPVLLKETAVFSASINDVVMVNKQYSYQILTKDSKNERYNITLRKVELATNKIEWIKKISSENNEEGDKIVIDDDGNIYVLGRKYNDNITDYVPIIYKLGSNGTQIWKKAVEVPGNFFSQSLCKANNNMLIYMCGYTKTQTGIAETRVVKLNNNGEPLISQTFSDFSGNGIIKLTNNNYFVFGSQFIVDEKQVVTKGKFVIVDSSLELVTSKSLDKDDKPDSELKLKTATSSDFLAATQLTDGRIAVGGKVFMPSGTNNTQQNNVLLLIVDIDGTYIK